MGGAPPNVLGVSRYMRVARRGHMAQSTRALQFAWLGHSLGLGFVSPNSVVACWCRSGGVVFLQMP